MKTLFIFLTFFFLAVGNSVVAQSSNFEAFKKAQQAKFDSFKNQKNAEFETFKKAQEKEFNEFTGVISPKIQAIAEKLGYKITVLGEHPNGGSNIQVECPSLKGTQNVSGVDGSNLLENEEGFVFIRNADIEVASVDYGNVYTIDTEHPDSAKFVKEERQIKKIIDKTSYVFTKESVERIITMKDGSFDKEIVLP